MILLSPLMVATARWLRGVESWGSLCWRRRTRAETTSELRCTHGGRGLSPAEFRDEAKLLLGAKLYEFGRLSSGQAARLCGMPRVEFLLSLARLGVSMSNLRAEDADAELCFAEHG